MEAVVVEGYLNNYFDMDNSRFQAQDEDKQTSESFQQVIYVNNLGDTVERSTSQTSLS